MTYGDLIKTTMPRDRKGLLFCPIPKDIPSVKFHEIFSEILVNMEPFFDVRPQQEIRLDQEGLIAALQGLTQFGSTVDIELLNEPRSPLESPIPNPLLEKGKHSNNPGKVEKCGSLVLKRRDNLND